MHLFEFYHSLFFFQGKKGAYFFCTQHPANMTTTSMSVLLRPWLQTVDLASIIECLSCYDPFRGSWIYQIILLWMTSYYIPLEEVVFIWGRFSRSCWWEVQLKLLYSNHLSSVWRCKSWIVAPCSSYRCLKTVCDAIVLQASYIFPTKHPFQPNFPLSNA